MGTKNNPGEYDCYDKAAPDEPIFTLRANDPDAPDVVRFWAMKRSERAPLDRAKVAEARQCAVEMENWRKQRLLRHPDKVAEILGLRRIDFPNEDEFKRSIDDLLVKWLGSAP